ncbi:MAG: hypothetical protein M5U28_19960 [Sandaracinaceae bacterium]|nr:hypothetical protein [Sandaracinaceae bacterium]
MEKAGGSYVSENPSKDAVVLASVVSRVTLPSRVIVTPCASALIALKV